jgi:hypothetical protein
MQLASAGKFPCEKLRVQERPSGAAMQLHQDPDSPFKLSHIKHLALHAGTNLHFDFLYILAITQQPWRRHRDAQSKGGRRAVRTRC